MNVLKKISKGSVEVKATICYFFSNICSKAFGFLTIPLYTNLLTTDEYGYLNTYNAWVSMLSIIMGLSLSSAIYGKVEENKRERYKIQSSLLFLSFIVAIIQAVIIIGVYILVIGQIDIILLLALVQGYATFVVNFMLQEWVIDNRYVLHSVVSVISVGIPILITCGIITQLYESQKYLCIIVPRAAVFFVAMILILMYVVLRGRCLFDVKIWKWSISYCIPIVFHSLSLTIMLQADRIMISYLFGYDESGVYSFIYNVTLIIGVFIAALENSWKSWFFNNYEKTTLEKIREKSRVYILVAIGCVSIYVLLSPELVRLLASKAYSSQIYLVSPIAFAYVISFLYDFLVYVEYKHAATKYIARASIVAALVNIALNFIIIPVYGGLGAAFTTIISYLFQFVLHFRVVRKLNKNLYEFRFFVQFILLGILIMLYFLLFIDMWIIRYVTLIIICGIVLCFIYKKRDLLS